ncbi:MAG: hypothetical protein ACR2P5_08745 [Gammaproteobacteria bacterium]
MNLKAIALGALAYTLATFAWAVAWHIVLFEPQYIAFGYFGAEPSFALGFLSILIQGCVLSALYPLVNLTGKPVLRGMKFAAWVGVFFWTSHVLALLAKQPVDGALLFLAMETFYLSVQFGMFGAAIGIIYAKK